MALRRRLGVKPFQTRILFICFYIFYATTLVLCLHLKQSFQHRKSRPRSATIARSLALWISCSVTMEHREEWDEAEGRKTCHWDWRPRGWAEPATGSPDHDRRKVLGRDSQRPSRGPAHAAVRPLPTVCRPPAGSKSRWRPSNWSRFSVARASPKSQFPTSANEKAKRRDAVTSLRWLSAIWSKLNLNN